jgi:hypothetical protein
VAAAVVVVVVVVVVVAEVVGVLMGNSEKRKKKKGQKGSGEVAGGGDSGCFVFYCYSVKFPFGFTERERSGVWGLAEEGRESFRLELKGREFSIPCAWNGMVRR